MIVGGVNLARRPFVNRRPVVRITAILWLLGAAAAAANVWLYWGSWTGSDTTGERLAAVEQRLGDARAEILALETALERQDLAAGNEQATYLNGKIAARRFAWSRLLDDLGDVLPLRVRIDQLAPRIAEAADSRSAVRRGNVPAASDEPVYLRLHGYAESDAALIELLDKLFAHPAFLEPDIKSESDSELRLIEFNASVEYDPTLSVGGPVTRLQPSASATLAEDLAAAGGQGLASRTSRGGGRR